MKKYGAIARFVVLMFCVVMLVCGGCAGDSGVPATTINRSSERLITKNGVGDYSIGRSSRADVLGPETSDSRARLAAVGLYFEFQQGNDLTAITVTSSDYALANGLRVGSTAADVRAELGEPLKRNVKSVPKNISIAALVYHDYMFALDAVEKVVAIRVGRWQMENTQ